MKSKRSKLAYEGLLSIVTKAMEAVLALLVVILLGRWLGAEGFGVYALVLAIVSMISMPTRLGLPQLVVRETATGQATGHWNTVVGIWRWSSGASLVLGLAAAAIGICFTLFLGYGTTTTGITLLIGLLLVPLLSLSNLRSAILRGLGFVGAANVAGLLAQPAVLLLLLAGFTLLSEGRMTPPMAISLTVISVLLSYLLGTWIIRQKQPLGTKGATPHFMPKKWLSASWPMAMTQGAHQINRYMDVIILGLLSTLVDAGIYRIAAQGAILVSLGIAAMGLVTAPRFAHLHALGNHEELQRLLWRSSQLALMLSALVALGFALAGQPVLIWLFGGEFSQAWPPLMVLSIAHVISAAIGPTGLVLNMTGHERHVTRAVAIAALLNIILNLALIPPFGAVGAAIATAISLVFWKTWLWFTARRVLGVRCSFI